MNNLLHKTQLFWKRNGSTILTCASAVGVVTTAVLAAKAAPKATLYLEEAKKEKSEELTTIEKVKVAGPSYIPTILVGASTIACMFSANVLNHRNQVGLAGAYALVDQSYKDYKNKVRELYGEETHQEIMNAIAVEQAQEIAVRASTYGNSCELTGEESCGEPVLFYDSFSNRYFENTIEQVINAEYHFNRNYVLRGYGYLNELYEFLGLDLTEYGEVLGWAQTDNDRIWIDFNHRKITLDDGLECYLLETVIEPEYDFLEY